MVTHTADAASPPAPKVAPAPARLPDPRGGPTLLGRITRLVLAIAVPLLALATGALWQQHRAEEALVARAHAMALLLDRDFAGAERVLRTLAGSSALARGDLPAFHAE